VITVTEQQPKQEGISNTKIDYSNSIMVDWMLFVAVFGRHPPFWRPWSLKW